MRVLIVEDDVNLALTLMWFTEALGDEGAICGTGIEAIAAAGSWKPDIVLIDLDLPDMDGADVCRKLRSSVGTSNTRLVAYTAFSARMSKSEIREAGFDEYLVKGSDFNRLTQLLEELHLAD